MLEKIKAFFRWLTDDPDSGEQHSVLKVRDAYLCVNSLDDAGSVCGEVFRYAPGGRCPDCGSTAVRPLSWLLKSAAERQAWLDKIGAARERRRLVALSRARKMTGQGNVG